MGELRIETEQQVAGEAVLITGHGDLLDRIDRIDKIIPFDP